MKIQIINGDLLKSDAKYIAHQCNCVSYYAAGLADAIFRKYPYSDTYSTRSGVSDLGTIDILGNGMDKRYIINMYAQYYPGSPYKFDNVDSRLKAFENCLNSISKIKELISINFPFRVGCGLARGDWSKYYSMLESFANNLPDVKVSLYKM